RFGDGLFLGSQSGLVAWFNVEEEGLPVDLFHHQTTSIRRLEHTRDGARLLVCSEWGEPATLVANLQETSTETSSSSGLTHWQAVTDQHM
ncbi:unnamed protein product, partial [Protopolystoma xenopodis]